MASLPTTQSGASRLRNFRIDPIILTFAVLLLISGGTYGNNTASLGGAIYALTSSGELTRYTPSGGDWRFRPPVPADALSAQRDGSLVVVGAQGERVLVWRVRPPNQAVSDSLSFKVGGEVPLLRMSLAQTIGAVGDRIFFGADEQVLAVQSGALPDDHPDLQAARGNLALTKQALGDLPGALVRGAILARHDQVGGEAKPLLGLGVGPHMQVEVRQATRAVGKRLEPGMRAGPSPGLAHIVELALDLGHRSVRIVAQSCSDSSIV